MPRDPVRPTPAARTAARRAPRSRARETRAGGSPRDSPGGTPGVTTASGLRPDGPAEGDGRPKIFVLDTSVVLYDYQAIDHFQEHDVAVPLTVLEELDQFKKGDNVINLHAREFIRRLDQLSRDHDLRGWCPLDPGAAEDRPAGPDAEVPRGRLRVIADEGDGGATREFGARKNDHRILDAALALARQEAPRRVILVTKDINLRVKARSVSLAAEDYETVRIKDVDHLYRGISEVSVGDPALIDRLYGDGSVPVDGSLERALADERGEGPAPHAYFILDGGGKSALATYEPRGEVLRRVHKTSAYGITPRNAEQTFALDAILDPDIPLVTITGAAGTGKTLLALAGALERRSRFRQIYLARPVVPLSNKDLGYLPGDVQSKINPYMAPLWDNLSVIKNQFSEGSKESRRIDEMIEKDKLHIIPLAYIRGRSFSNIMFIVDEAQNLTPHEIKTIITRAGEGTKVVLTGDIFQIDTPYLDASSNGLSYMIDRLRGHRLYAHITLQKGERSELANLASTFL